MLKLIIEDDEGRKTVVPFVRDEITIGRQEGNTIRLTERNVSRRHARLFRQNGHVCVEDLGSYNGIRINGDKISGQTPVHEGDLIQIADYDLSVQSDQAAQAAAGGNGHHDTMPQTPAARSELTTMRLDGITRPLAQVEEPSRTLADEDGPAEANPDDVQPAPPSDPNVPAAGAPKNQSTAVIRMDQVEGARGGRTVVDLDPTEAPRLVVLNTEFAGREFACIRTELRVGRTEDNDIAIDHRSLSRTHCKVVREDSGEWRVLDMESANGLMVNGESYAQATLRSGDVIELGHVKVKFVGPGESFTLTATQDGVKVKTGSKTPLVAVAVVLVAALAGGGYFVMKRPAGSAITEVPPAKPPPPVEPPPVEKPVVARPPDEVKPAVPPDGVKPDEPVKPEDPTPRVTPEEQLIAEQQALNAATLAKAQTAIEQGDLASAEQLLGQCKVGKSPCPEARQKLAQIQAEKGHKAALDKVERALADKKPDAARRLLDEASGTTVFQGRHTELKERLNQLTEQQLLAKKPPEPAPKPVEPAKPPEPVAPKVTEGSKLYDEALKLSKDAQNNPAKARLLKCIKLEPGNSDCHRLLGSTYAKLQDPSNGVKHYKKFLDLAPDHPSADKVRAIVEAYEGSQKR